MHYYIPCSSVFSEFLFVWIHCWENEVFLLQSSCSRHKQERQKTLYFASCSFSTIVAKPRAFLYWCWDIKKDKLIKFIFCSFSPCPSNEKLGCLAGPYISSPDLLSGTVTGNCITNWDAVLEFPFWCYLYFWGGATKVVRPDCLYTILPLVNFMEALYTF